MGLAPFIHRLAGMIRYSAGMKMLARCAAVLSVILSLGLSASAPAQQALPTLVPVQQQRLPDEATPALWVTSDADTTIYLFGTIHILRAGTEWFHGKLLTAARSSDELVTEIPDSDQSEIQAILLDLGILPAGQTLRALLPANDRAALERELVRLGQPINAFDRFKPWYAADLIMLLEAGRVNINAANGPESVISEYFQSIHKPRSGLETLRGQFQLLDSLPVPLQRRYLGEAANEAPTIAGELEELIAAWSRGDADQLAIINSDMKDEPELREILLTGRNRNWASWIKARLEKPGTVFVAVGAGHLAGEGSVQDQLKSLGIATNRVQ